MNVLYNIDTSLNEKKTLSVSYQLRISSVIGASCIIVGGVNLGGIFELMPYNTAAEIRLQLYPMSGCALGVPAVNRRLFVLVFGIL